MSNDATGPAEPNSGDLTGAANVPPAPPAAPQPASAPVPPASAPVPPAPAPGQPAPGYGQPAAPGYGQPAAPAYGQPAPGYGQPPQGAPAPGYGAPAGAPYGAQPGYGAPVQPNIVINLWLSVFFGWIPALIFFLIEKDKVPANYQRANAANLNFQIVLAIAYAACVVLSFVIIGAFLLPLVSLAQLIIGIIHAINVPPQLAAGQEGKFYLAPNWIK